MKQLPLPFDKRNVITNGDFDNNPRVYDFQRIVTHFRRTSQLNCRSYYWDSNLSINEQIAVERAIHNNLTGE